MAAESSSATSDGLTPERLSGSVSCLATAHLEVRADDVLLREVCDALMPVGWGLIKSTLTEYEESA
jgi:hypothetical protein